LHATEITGALCNTGDADAEAGATRLILPSRSFVQFASLDRGNVGFDDSDAERSVDATEHPFLRSSRSRFTSILLFLL
jgi:hypothetical protein